MSQEISDELIKNIRYYVKKYNSKIDTANKLGLSYDTVLFYTKDIRIKSRKKDIEYSGIYGKSLELLKEVMQNGYTFSSGKYGPKEYIKLKKYFPQIRRTKMYGMVICYMDDKSKMAAKALLEVSNKKVMSYHELMQITKVFGTALSKVEKTRYIRKSKDNDLNINSSLQEKDDSLAFFCIRKYWIAVVPKVA